MHSMTPVSSRSDCLISVLPPSIHILQRPQCRLAMLAFLSKPMLNNPIARITYDDVPCVLYNMNPGPKSGGIPGKAPKNFPSPLLSVYVDSLYSYVHAVSSFCIYATLN